MVSSGTDLVVDLHDLTKIYRGRVHALRGIQMQVRRGEIFGLLGPNGAGKSTLVKIMMTVVRPTKARGTMLGSPIGHKAALARVGYLPEHHRFPTYLTGRQAIEFYGALANVPRAERKKRATELLATVGMSGWGDKKVSAYSKGMMQRVGLAAALINNPDFVVLDEPTDGVDPVGRREIRDVLLLLKSQGKTVFLNSHLLSELEMVCDNVAILVQGRVAMQGTIETLTAGSRRIEIIIEGALSGTIHGFESLTIEALPKATRLLHLSDDIDAVQPLIDRLRADGRVIQSLRVLRDSLEDLFMRAVIDPTTGQPLSPGAGPMAAKGAGR